MRAWQISAFGLDQLRPLPYKTPVPQPGEVRVRIHAVSLNYRDLLMVTGAYDPRVPLPLIPCSDGAGVVDQVGEGVDLAIGTRVTVAFAPAWTDGPPRPEHLKQTLGGPLPGTLATHIVVPASGVVPTPDHLSDVQACTLPCAGVTAYNALQAAGIGEGSRVLSLGTGGVSTWALQLAKARGAEVLMTSSSADKASQMLDLGASSVLDYTADPAWGRTVARDGGVDLVVELGGVGTLEQSLRACRTGGTIALIGVLAGSKAPVNLTRAFMHSQRLQGIMVGSVADLRAMAAEVVAHRLEPVIDQVFPFDRAPDAFARLASGEHVGKVVISG